MSSNKIPYNSLRRFRRTIREFNAKERPDRIGNTVHVNISLQDGKVSLLSAVRASYDFERLFDRYVLKVQSWLKDDNNWSEDEVLVDVEFDFDNKTITTYSKKFICGEWHDIKYTEIQNDF